MVKLKLSFKNYTKRYFASNFTFITFAYLIFKRNYNSAKNKQGNMWSLT